LWGGWTFSKIGWTFLMYWPENNFGARQHWENTLSHCCHRQEVV
jgi:hypothetical protein